MHENQTRKNSTYKLNFILETNKTSTKRDFKKYMYR